MCATRIITLSMYFTHKLFAFIPKEVFSILSNHFHKMLASFKTSFLAWSAMKYIGNIENTLYEWKVCEGN